MKLLQCALAGCLVVALVAAAPADDQAAAKIDKDKIVGAWKVKKLLPGFPPGETYEFTKDGKPVTAGLVIFEPVSQKISARGEIQADGSFQLGTHRDNDGALEGEYKVLVAPPPLPEEGKRRRSPVHPKYQSLESTPLKFTVTRHRDKNKFNIEVE